MIEKKQIINFQSMRAFILGFFIVILSSSMVNGQMAKTKILGVYVYNFANQIDWPQEDTLSSFNIQVFTEDQAFIDEMQNMAYLQKIKGKEIHLEVIDDIEGDFSHAQMIVLGADKVDFFLPIFDKIENSPSLLVSLEYEDKRFVMLNLFETNIGEIHFEINKVNVSNQGLEIRDQLLLLGGSEIDLTELYISSQKSLRDLEKESEENQLELNKLIQKVKQTEVDLYNDSIKLLKQDSLFSMKLQQEDSLLSKIEKQNKSFREQSQITKLKEQELLQISNDFEKEHNILIEQEKLIAERKKEIDQQNETLKVLNKDINVLQTNSDTQQEAIIVQGDIISKQKTTLWALILFSLVVIAFVIYAIKSRNTIKAKNGLLFSQKSEIENKNNALADSVIEIKSVNDQLNVNNTKLQSTLDSLHKTKEQLVHQEKMASLGTLSAGIAHEINNPINFVTAGVNSLETDFNDLKMVLNVIDKFDASQPDKLEEQIKVLEETKEEYYYDDAIEAIGQTLSDIQIGAARVAEIIKGLSGYTQVDNAPWSETSVASVVNSSLLILKNKYKGFVEITKDFAEGIPPILCHPGKLNQVFVNIIGNAVDAIISNNENKKDGKLIITVSQEKENIKISIKDNGIGMSQETIKKIFDPFFTTKDVGKGTGLGMSISYNIIKEFHGTINVYSEVSLGTEFVLHLPINNMQS